MSDVSAGRKMIVNQPELESRNQEYQALLRTFLESAQCPVNTMNFFQLDGYLRALACAPVSLPLTHWQPLIFNDTTPTYSDGVEEAKIQDMLMNLYNFHIAQVINSRCSLPFSTTYYVLQEDRIEIEQWARGFLQGYIMCESQWNQRLDEIQSGQCDHKIGSDKIIDDFDDILSIVSVVADAEYAIQNGTAPEELDVIFASLPRSVIRCGQIGRAVNENKSVREDSKGVEVMLSALTPKPVLQRQPNTKKVNRNEPCLCGSGKKFKKCCLH